MDVQRSIDGYVGNNSDSVSARMYQWSLVTVLLIFYVFAVMDRSVISMVVDPVRKDFHISDTQVALLMGIAYSGAYGGAAVPLDYFVDKGSRKWLLYIAVTFFGLAEAACGLAGSFTALFLARMGVGLGESPLLPSAHSMITDTFPKRRLATAISFYSTGASIGAGVALILGGWIVNRLLGHSTVSVLGMIALKPWQLVFVITGLPNIVLALLILFFREPARRKTQGEVGIGSWRELGVFLRRKWWMTICLIVAFGGMSVVNGALIKWQPSYMGRYFHLNPAQYGLALGLLYAIGGVVGMMIAGYIVDV
jgi:MFS family permease